LELYTINYYSENEVKRVESKFTITSFMEKKKSKEKITMLTAYDYPTARALDGEVDTLLVGDSVGMVKLGYKDTLSVTVDDMIYHTKSVRRGAENAFIVTDMPYLSYHINTEDTIVNAARIIVEGKANAVKIEGGSERLEAIKALISAEIPVMGHLGLTPQSVNVTGGYKIQSKTADSAKKLVAEAEKLQNAGVFAIVLECIPKEVAKYVTDKLEIPTIGIGAGKHCDGQVLVIDDLIGLNNETTPKFVKQYGNLFDEILKMVKSYNKDVKTGDFPEEKHSFKIDELELEKIERLY
jgi:3-methyl-2-oxobutanoate hydroxymethyltransferase